MPLKKHDFVLLDYTGKLEDNTIFDTTQESVAKKHNLRSEGTKYKPITICIGESQIVSGLDESLMGKEAGKEFTITLPPEKAFGKKDIKLIKLIPMAVFKKQNVMPQPGLKVNIDGRVATVLRVSGGRVIVDYNHPLANRTITYDISIRKQISDKKEQIESFLGSTLPIKCEVAVNDAAATIQTEQKLPDELAKPLAKKLLELVGLTVEFAAKKHTTPE